MIANRLIPALSATGFYTKTINQSCRFNDDDSAQMTRTPAGAGTEETFTFSTWLKRANLGSIMQLFNAAAGNEIQFTAADKLLFTTATATLLTTALFRDVTNWFHIVLAVDTTQATAANRVKLYVNGVQITVFDTETYPNLNEVTEFNKAAAHTLCANEGDTEEFDGYLAETIFIDGIQLAATSFGEFKTGVWIPKSYGGSYGTNGFKLNYANSADLGNDVSGNGNDWTPAGLATNDQADDSPTNNHPTLNVLHHLSTATLANGNLDCSGTENEYATEQIPSSGKWGWKITVSEDGSFGLEDIDGNEEVAADVSGEVVEMLVDMDAGTLKKKVDGGGLETIEASLNTGSEWYPHFKAACSVDFGQLGYSPTETGYKTLCVSNRDDPAITEPDSGFDAVLYTGSGAEKSITDLEFQPDLVWIKNRDQADEHKLIDSVRGVTKKITSNDYAIEATDANGLTAFNSDGFTLGTGAGGYNDSAEKFVAWCFKKLAEFGFDIVSYSGTGVAKAVNHSLNAAPELIIIKNLTGAYNFAVYHHHAKTKTDPETDYGILNNPNAWTDLNTIWNDVAPTATQFTVGTADQVNKNTDNYIAYLFKSIDGFSKIFSFEGNGNADGPFIYSGFRPKFILIKDADVGYNWHIFDSARSVCNVADNDLLPNSTNIEATTTFADFLSNGFKLRTSGVGYNVNLKTHIGIALAKMPGKWANAR